MENTQESGAAQEGTQTPPSGSEQTSQTQTTQSASSAPSTPEPKSVLGDLTEEKVEEKAEGEGEKKTEEKKEGAPEKYEPFKLPEGVELPEEKLAQITETFKKHGLSQDAAQELIDLHTNALKEAVEGPSRFWNDLQSQWTQEIANDEKLGSKDLKNPLNKEAAGRIGRLMDQYGNNDVRKALWMTGAGNNPALIRMFDALAQALTEGSPKAPAGGPTARKPSTLGEALYGSSGPSTTTRG